MTTSEAMAAAAAEAYEVARGAYAEALACGGDVRLTRSAAREAGLLAHATRKRYRELAESAGARQFITIINP